MFNRKLLQALLIRQNVSQAELAAAVGCSQSFLSMIIMGYKTPSLLLAYRIARYFGLTVDSFIIPEEEG